jgi:hypothetical protein
MLGLKIRQWKGTQTFNPTETKQYNTIAYTSPIEFSSLPAAPNPYCAGLNGNDCNDYHIQCWSTGIGGKCKHARIKYCSLNEELSNNGEYYIYVIVNNLFMIYKQKVKFTDSGLILI